MVGGEGTWGRRGDESGLEGDGEWKTELKGEAGWMKRTRWMD